MKLHYYMFTFSYSSLGRAGYGTVYLGYSNQLINKSRIEEARTAFIDSNSDLNNNCCIAISYLGWMTPEEMRE